MKKRSATVLIGLFGCQSGQIELSGVAKAPGNPARFVELCEKGDPTAKALQKATEVTDCIAREMCWRTLRRLISIEVNWML